MHSLVSVTKYLLPSCGSGMFSTNPKQVKRWHKEWLAGELFENLHTDGIVVKVASGATKQKLGVNSVCPNWAIAIK